MVLVCHINVSYLSEYNAHSRARGHFFLANNDNIPQNKDLILTFAQIIKHWGLTVAEA